MRIRPLVLAFLAGGFFIGADFASAAVDANGNALPDEGSSDQAAELAKQLQNPVASLISVPFQNNFDFNLGPNDDGFRYTLNFQPVIPLSISKDYNLIIRTIVPFIHQDDVIPGTNQDGLSDIVQSFFFSPKQPVAGWILALGPVFLWPTATNDLLGSEKWGAGPTGLLLQQKGGWLWNSVQPHLELRRRRSSHLRQLTFLQPFLSHTTKSHTTFGINSESTYDWHNDQWTMRKPND